MITSPAPARTATSTTHQSAAGAVLYRRHFASLCAFARTRGCEAHDAEDAAQELFAKLVAQGQIERAAAIPDNGEQSAFLLARMRTVLIKRWQFRTRQRRGGGCVCFSLHDAEGQSIDVPDEHATPDREQDRDWARAVLDRALERVNQELCSSGHREVWKRLESDLVDETPHLEAQSGALRVALCRARRRLRDFIREQLGASTEDAARMLGAALV
ncbi:MAG: hypothetical protein JNG86_23280 [Verrucomicrobiaceae bacterium]|nr:hypothetical protein [Verrucomicrobiaceae bacterium]